MFAFAASGATDTFSFQNINAPIPDGSLAGLSDTRSVTSSIATVTRVTVKLNIAGEFNGDLYCYLRHMDATRTNLVVLLNRPGRASTNLFGYPDAGLNVTFDDSAASGDIHWYRNVTTPAPGSPLTGTWQPDARKVDPTTVTEASTRSTMLSAFTGGSGSGTWSLYIVDTDSGATNMLKSWELEFSGATVPSITWTAPSDITYGTALSSAQLNANSPVAGTYSYTPPAGTILNAGSAHTLSVTFTPTDTATYLPVTTNVAINVLKKDLIITANPTNKIYGAANPTFTASYSGFVNGDTSSVLTSPVTLSSTATAASPIGTYPITATGADAANYNITYAAGTLAVTHAPLLITADNTARTYGAANPTFTASYSGFLNGDTPSVLTTPPSLSTTATLASPVGSYPINASGAAAANYFISYSPGSLSITPAALLITANNASKVYGSANPAFTASYSGFVNGDMPAALTTPVTLSSTATTGSPVGDYPITASGAASPNYSITYSPGTLSVTTAALVISANSTSKVYGSANPAFTASYSGFVNGDTAAVLTSPATLSSTATSASSVGTYPITATGADAANYNITYSPGTLTITPAATTTLISSSANPALPGALVTFIATITIVPAGAGTVDGTVQFKVDGINSGSPVPVASGSAALVTSSLSVGTYAITAEYLGSANLTASSATLSPAQLINTPPIAATDTIQRSATNGTKVTITTLLSNDTDADGDTITFVAAASTTAAGGAISRSNDWLIYSPPADFTDADSFTYTITDGRGAPVNGTVNITPADPGATSNLSVVSLGNSVYRINLDGIPNRPYRIQYKNDLSAPDWTDLHSGTTDAAGMMSHTDDRTSGPPTRFYRSISP